MVRMVNCSREVSKFELQLRYYVNFQTNPLCKCVTIYPLADAHYLNFLNHSWPSDRLVISLIPFLYKHNIHNREGGRKENKHGFGLAPSTRSEKFVTLLRSFLCICELSRACIRVKFPKSHSERRLILSRWPTRPLGPQVLAVAFL